MRFSLEMSTKGDGSPAESIEIVLGHTRCQLGLKCVFLSLPDHETGISNG